MCKKNVIAERFAAVFSSFPNEEPSSITVNYQMTPVCALNTNKDERGKVVSTYEKPLSEVLH